MAKDEFGRQWILDNGIPIVKEYGSELTLRALHYRLVALGMTNSQTHYKRVISAMTKARWDGLVNFYDFSDHERDVIGTTAADPTDIDSGVYTGERQVQAWMENYHLNRWENQETYLEVFIEKKALQGVFEQPCSENDVALCPCKGYPSLTYVYRAAERFHKAYDRNQRLVILYFGDYDPSGEDIPRSLQEVLARMGCYLEVARIALLEDQVVDWNLPSAPTKLTDSRSANWNGLGQVELDAVEPRQLQHLVSEAIRTYFDEDRYEELQEREAKEALEYRSRLKEFVSNL